MGLAEAVATGDQRHGFLVVHAHAREGVADVLRGQQRIGITVRAFGAHVDQAHLHRGQGVFQVAAVHVAIRIVVRNQDRAGLGDTFVAVGIAQVAAEPFGFAAPVDVLIRLPGVHTSASEAERLEAHGFQRDVTGQDDQVAP